MKFYLDDVSNKVLQGLSTLPRFKLYEFVDMGSVNLSLTSDKAHAQNKTSIAGLG